MMYSGGSRREDSAFLHILLLMFDGVWLQLQPNASSALSRDLFLSLAGSADASRALFAVP
jgi:hypothetical protein